MKKFKQFLNQIAVIPNVIHFKMNLKAVTSTPIHFKSPNKSSDRTVTDDTVKESVEGNVHPLVAKFQEHEHPEEAMMHGNDNITPQSISTEIHKGIKAPTLDQKRGLRYYTSLDASTPFNKRLIRNHQKGSDPTEGMNDDEKHAHQTISELAKHGVGRELSVYSGVSFNPKLVAEKSSDGTMYSPAHISATHNARVAFGFARQHQSAAGTSHIMHIRLKPGDPAVHAGKHSTFPMEHETVIPPGKLKYLGTSTHHHPSDFFPESNKDKTYIHHFEIARTDS